MLYATDGGSARLSFFNSMGADRQMFYDVYNEIANMDLLEASFDSNLKSFFIPDLDVEGEWEGTRRKY